MSSPYRVSCPECHQALVVSVDHADCLTKCPFCKCVFKINPVGPAAPLKQQPKTENMLQFHTVIVDPAQYAEPEYWAKPANSNPGGASSAAPSRSGSSSGQSGRPQPVRRHPGKDVGKVVVQTRPPRQSTQQRRRPSINELRSRQSPIDETLTAAGVIMLLVGVVLSLFSIFRWDNGFVNVINESFPVLSLLLTLSGFGIVIYANRAQGVLALTMLSVFGVIVSATVASWSHWISPEQRSTAVAQEEEVRDERGPGRRAQQESQSRRSGVMISNDTGTDAIEADRPLSQPSQKEPKEHWNPFLINPEVLDDDEDGFETDWNSGDAEDRTGAENSDSSSKNADKQPTASGIRTIAQIRNRYNNGKPISSSLRRKYKAGKDFAGTLTSRGRVIGNGTPIVGLDFTQEFRTNMLTPVYQGDDVLSQSLVMDGMQLAGFNLAFRAYRVVAVQAIFAPSNGLRLQMHDRKKSDWIGDRSNADSYERVASDGRPVTALSVFIRDEYVYGVGLAFDAP